MNREDVAYCAGLYEGEGFVGSSIQKAGRYWNNNGQKFYTHKEHCYMSLQIKMTDWEPLYRFWETVDVGSLRGPTSNGPNRKDYYKYTISNFEHIQYVIVILWPWLSPRRREQFKIATRKYLSYK